VDREHCDAAPLPRLAELQAKGPRLYEGRADLPRRARLGRPPLQRAEQRRERVAVFFEGLQLADPGL
jgi:hypothetical protein